MTSLHVFIFCCISAASAAASAALEVSGHVGGDVSILCSGSWTADNSSEHDIMFFCRGMCSGGNSLIQTAGKSLTVTRRGRYSMEVNGREGAFNVTVRRLKWADAGRYHCGVGKTFNVLHQEVNLMVINASTVPPGSLPPSATTQRREAETQPLGSTASSPAASPATLPAADGKTNQKAATKLTDTTVVIIVSVSLALLVCAIIPLIFYGHCRTNPESQLREGANKGEADSYEDNADTQAAVRLQSLDSEANTESRASQYAAVYQALDPKSLD